MWKVAGAFIQNAKLPDSFKVKTELKQIRGEWTHDLIDLFYIIKCRVKIFAVYTCKYFPLFHHYNPDPRLIVRAYSMVALRVIFRVPNL